MDRFSFVLVLLSIIVGLGVTELLTNLARQIQARREIRFYWPHSVLVIAVFLGLLQQWWESWDQRLVEVWTFPVLLLMLGGPVCMYIISHLLFPKEISKTDFKAFYYDNARIIHLAAVLAVISSTLYRPLSFGHGLIDPDNLTSALGVAAFLILALTQRRWVHETIVPLIFVAVLGDLLVFHLSL